MNHKKVILILVVLLFVFGLDSLFAKPLNINGKVIDESGNILQGASVEVEGTTITTLTDVEGVYKISAEKGQKLFFSMEGFQTEKIDLNDQDNLNVVLKQDFIVSGVIYNARTKLPIEAASVSCGKFSAEFSDANGRFTISTRSKSDILTVKSDGYHSSDISLRGRDEIIIYLHADASISVQEYAYDAFTRKKRMYTTQSIATINPSTQSSADKTNAGSGEASFDGRIAGLDVRSRNGIKGIGSNLFLRGYSSLYCNNQPLVIVDGMIYDIQNYGTSLINGYYSNPLAGINIEDIENITVVRDAASIYGAKASNGVIFIRTNHTEKQATSIELSVSGNMEFAPENLPMLTSEDYRTYLNEIMLDAYGINAVSGMAFLNTDETSSNYYTYHNNTNWQDKVYNDNYSTNYNLKIKGGDDVALYAINVGFMQQNGTVKESDNSRFNLRFNSDIKFSPNFILHSNIGFYYTKNDITGSGVASNYDPVYISRIKAPFLNDYILDENGVKTPDLSDYDFLNVSNPVALINNMIQEDAAYRLFGSFNFDWKINEHFSVSDLVGISFDKDRQRIFIPSYGIASDTVDYGVITNQMKTRIRRDFVINNDFRLNYNNEFAFEHKINLMAGARLNINNLEEDWGGDYNSANDQLQSLGNGNYLLRTKGGFLGEWSGLTWYLDAEYAFMNRYLLKATLSLDGSSRFGDNVEGINMFDTPFVPYYGLSCAWIVSSENFMAGLSFIDLFKLRASYGTTGNDDIGNYTARQYYTSDNFLGYQGIVLGNLWNPELGPEKTTKTNLGLDLAVFNEKLILSFDLFSNKTTNIFDYLPANDISGFDGYYANYGGFSTTGFELSLNSTLINSKSFKWDLGFVFSKFETKVDELYGDSRYETFYTANILTETGSPLSRFYGYKTKGVYSTNNEAVEAGLVNRMDNEELLAFEAGDVIFEDFTSDGIIDAGDMQVIGDPTPDFIGEVFTRIQYKKITLDASLSFSYGNDVFNYMRYTLENMSTTNNQTQSVLNRWRYDGQVTDVPRAEYGDPMGNSRFSDRWIEDGSYARLKNITLSYMIPINTNFMKYAEIFASGVNLFTFTRYKGADPEFSIDGSALMQGIDLGMVPQNKMVLIGVKIGL